LRDIFAKPLDRAELGDLAQLVTADGLFSWRSPGAREIAHLRGRLPDERLIDLMASEPRLIRRPLARRGDVLVVGFDPERLAALAG